MVPAACSLLAAGAFSSLLLQTSHMRIIVEVHYYAIMDLTIRVCDVDSGEIQYVSRVSFEYGSSYHKKRLYRAVDDFMEFLKRHSLDGFYCFDIMQEQDKQLILPF